MRERIPARSINVTICDNAMHAAGDSRVMKRKKADIYIYFYFTPRITAINIRRTLLGRDIVVVLITERCGRRVKK